MEQQKVPDMAVSAAYDTDAENETGYSSHDSSCHQDESSESSWNNISHSLSKEVSEDASPAFEFVDHNICGNEDEPMTMCGFDELEDLLYHFEKFFREKLETHLTDFTSSMQSMFTEQQIHVRHIVNSAVCTDTGQNGQEDLLPPGCEDQNFPIPGAECMELLPRPAAEEQFPYNNGVRPQMLMELLALSCELSSILHQDKFRT